MKQLLSGRWAFARRKSVNRYPDFPILMSEDLPFFELSRAKKYDPELILRSGPDPEGEFVLALALIYNDFKSIMYFHKILVEHEPNDDHPIEYRGQWAGMAHQLDRYALSIAHELIKLVAESREALASPGVKASERKMPPRIRGRWNDIKRIGSGTDDKSIKDFVSALRHIRDTLSFHYYKPKSLAKGYRSHFTQQEDDERNQYAFVSFGKMLSDTRFYFADAAIETAIAEAKDLPRFSDRAGDFFESMNRALMYMIKGFIEHRREVGSSE